MEFYIYRAQNDNDFDLENVKTYTQVDKNEQRSTIQKWMSEYIEIGFIQ